MAVEMHSSWHRVFNKDEFTVSVSMSFFSSEVNELGAELSCNDKDLKCRAVEWLRLDCTPQRRLPLFLLLLGQPPVLPKLPSFLIALDFSPRSPSGASLYLCFGNLLASIVTEQGSKPV